MSRMNVDENLYFNEVFTLGPSFRTNVTVSLTSNSITFESQEAKIDQNVHLDDVVGAKVVPSGTIDSDESAFIHIYSYPLKKKKFSKTFRRCRVENAFRVAGRENPRENLEIAEKWVRCIKWLKSKNCDVNFVTKHSVCPPREKFLIFINPFGGKGSAGELFEKNVRPLLDEADIDYEIKFTDHMGHAKEIIQSMEAVKKFDCILCCSGDGIINEVVNGLMSRADWQEAIKTPIGHIPCGTGNGLCAAALYHSGEPFDMISSVFTVVTGEVFPLDIIKAQTVTSEAQYSFLSIVFGIVSDVDIESEKYRYMGDIRFSFMAVRKIMEKQSFSAKLWYLPADGETGIHGTSCDGTNGESKSHHSHGDGASDGTLKAEEGNEEHQKLKGGELEGENLKDSILGNGLLNDPPASEDFVDIALKGDKEGGNLNHCKVEGGTLSDGILGDGRLGNGILADGGSGAPNRNLPDYREPIPESWKLIEGDFVGWLFVSTSHIGKDAFCAPDATFGDGVLHCLCLTGEMSRIDLINVLGKLKNGNHVDVHGVYMIKARAFRIEPHAAASKIITIDGERVECGKTQGEIFKGMGRVRCRRPPETTNRNEEL